jgi:C-8 sterol isomerase
MSKFVFDPDVVHECSLACLGKPKPEMFDVFADALDARVPGVLDRGQPWLYSIAGGAMIQMKLYYASISEYIMIWGTPIGSEGHSGRHFAGFWDTVIDGETWYCGEGQFEKTVYKPGDRIYVGPGQARAMNFTDGVWAVEYARGFIPYSVPFGIADELLSCFDWVTAAQTLTLYTDLVCQSIGHGRPMLAPATSRVSAVARNLTQRLVPPPEVQPIPKDNIPFFRRA